MQDHKILALLISMALFITPGLVSVRNTWPGSRAYDDAITVQYGTDLFFVAALFYFMFFVTIVTINDVRLQEDRSSAARDAGG